MSQSTTETQKVAAERIFSAVSFVFVCLGFKRWPPVGSEGVTDVCTFKYLCMEERRGLRRNALP